MKASGSVGQQRGMRQHLTKTAGGVMSINHISAGLQAGNVPLRSDSQLAGSTNLRDLLMTDELAAFSFLRDNPSKLLCMTDLHAS